MKKMKEKDNSHVVASKDAYIVMGERRKRRENFEIYFALDATNAKNLIFDAN